MTTDGPFPEAKEQLAGYLLVDCATPERALESRRACPTRGSAPSRCARSCTRPPPAGERGRGAPPRGGGARPGAGGGAAGA
ncbi:YciI family protein, partial [Spirillospora sp. NPDC052242]